MKTYWHVVHRGYQIYGIEQHKTKKCQLVEASVASYSYEWAAIEDAALRNNKKPMINSLTNLNHAKQ